VARVTEVPRLRRATPSGVPFVELTDAHNDLEEMVEEIRRALRTVKTIS
jgi:hypothetical protein